MTTAKRTDDDPYAILGVARGSSDAIIRTAHRALARRFHPDIAGDGATAPMMRINAAFDAIRSADRRVAFDGLDHWSASPGREPERRPGEPGYHPGPDRGRWARERDGTGAAGSPPGRPSGSVLDFGRHKGWSIGEIARVDPGYLDWLADRRQGLPYLDEIDAILRRVGVRPDGSPSGGRVERSWRMFRRG
ncbi:MAG: DnaJ domain-containing protein [Candidatus Limnocylindrales bacterium]